MCLQVVRIEVTLQQNHGGNAVDGGLASRLAMWLPRRVRSASRLVRRSSHISHGQAEAGLELDGKLARPLRLRTLLAIHAARVSQQNSIHAMRAAMRVSS